MKKKGIPGHPEVARRVRMARGSADLTLGNLAQQVSAILDTPLSREIIRRVELGERDAEVQLLWAIAEVTGEPFGFLVEPLGEIRDLSRANPGLRDLNEGTRHLCWDCVEDPNAHVLAEWLIPGGQIPGQVELFVEAA